MIVAWAIGGEPFYFPNDLGFSVGGPDDEFFYIMETHIDNPTRKSDMIDNSGIRITITQSLRKHEAGMLQLGHLVGYSQIIPPGQKQLLSKGYCSEECVREGFRQSNLTEIKIIGSVQHSHLLGVGMTTRHFRNGSELKPLVDDPNYDFNFQAIRVLPKEVSVYPGDSFRTDCTYDSTTRTGLTLGGLSTREEMCLTFAYYYPRMKLEYCESEPAFDAFGIDPQNLFHDLSMLDWTNKTTVDWALSTINKGKIRQECGGEKFQHQATQFYHPTEPAHPYVPPPANCS
ncbi:DBH-like monooxygenase protein 1 [Mercenaria mercenaria]|uniref:DBH-like monooxygenase protein 1 n=1 Tax=Mercenaria mercenaria TaxID=6596 RepID=UPI00234F76BB|nr:DBH-like monooxygenase protein 1 [Mercenaria mercenaria]